MSPNSFGTESQPKGGADWVRFDWRAALQAVCDRVPRLLQEPRIASLLDAGCQVNVQQALAAAARLLAVPDLTYAVAGLHRPVLLHVVGHLVEHSSTGVGAARRQLTGDGDGGNPDATNAALAVAIVRVLDLAPHAHRLVERHFRHAPSPLACLQAQLDSAAAAGTNNSTSGPHDAAGGPLTEPSPSTWQLAGAAMRLIQLMPLQRRLHDQGVLLRLLHHAQPDVRWCAARSLALLFNLGDAGREKLERQVLTQEQGLAASLRWRAERDVAAAEAASAWLPAPVTAAAAEAGGGSASDESSDSDVDMDGMGQDVVPAGAAGQLAPPPEHVEVAGLLLPRRDTALAASNGGSATGQQRLVRTPAVERNLRAAALALCQQQPLLLQGPPGSGKTAIVNELAAETGNLDMVRITLDDQMDAKSLLGAYVCTATPGEFVWQPGPLTQAVAGGKWLLVEGIDSAPPEVLAALAPLLEGRSLHLSHRAQVITAGPGFQFLATVTSAPASGAGAYSSAQAVHDMLGGLLATVTIEAPPPREQLAILEALFPQLAPLLHHALAMLAIVHASPTQADSAGLGDAQLAALVASAAAQVAGLRLGRHFSIRDVIKWCRRMQAMHGPLLERALRPSAMLPPSMADVSIEVRHAAFVEAADCFAAMIPALEARRQMRAVLAALWAVPLADVEARDANAKPVLRQSGNELSVGRATLRHTLPEAAAPQKERRAFAETGHSMRLLEGVAAAVAQVEPVLLVGETGTGKTAIAQHLAEQAGAHLVVLNLSQQTDSSDLLGGFRPVEARDALAPLLPAFNDLVTRTWSRGNNADFLGRVAKLAARRKWVPLVAAFRTALRKVEASTVDENTSEAAADSGAAERPKKRAKLKGGMASAALGSQPAGKPKAAEAVSPAVLREWRHFAEQLAAAERAAQAAEGGFAFAFVEGALATALRDGSWLLLDEVNLAPPEALQRVAALAEAADASVTLAERGDAAPLPRHPNFRLLAAMNPATDVGKRDLPPALRARFTELWVGEPAARGELAALAAAYLADAVPNPPVESIVDFYLAAKAEADATLTDGGGGKPGYSLRTLCRALTYTRAALPAYGLQRALYDGIAMAFLTQLAPDSAPKMEALLRTHLLPGVSLKGFWRAPPRPNGGNFVLFQQFWVEAGPLPLPEAGPQTDGHGQAFVQTTSVEGHLRSLARAVLLRRHPILLQGPTSSGKTSLVAYLAAQTGHEFVRINNHQGTDLQEYLGSYVTDASGRLVFREGALLTALRRGQWLVLDELNLAPSEVLEALNRLLDDNRELYVPELREAVRPHPHFMLFATQNPAGGAYAGRRPLSRAFRSRFLELHVGDIPDNELAEILERRCGIAPSYAKKLVATMRELQRRRQGSNVFAGKHGFITPRDLFRWAGRGAVGYQQLAEDGYAVLAERLREPAERAVVADVLQKILNVQLDMDALYMREGDAPQAALQGGAGQPLLQGIVWTPSMRRMYTLLLRAVRFQEPVLLVGETGTGKTTVVQAAASAAGAQLHIVNCNQHTEASDFLGGFRPTRNRDKAVLQFEAALRRVGASELLRSRGGPTPAAGLASTMGVQDMVVAAGAAATALAALESAAESVEGIAGEMEELRAAVTELAAAAAEARRPFVWEDGPLVAAMRRGDWILVDELNLAEDAVIERLNSVLEPGRTLTLAEKGGTGSEVIRAAPGFRLFATMNPGGDFGKKELSPALANRFTTVWVPAIHDEAELAAILRSRLLGEEMQREVAPRLLAFWQHFQAAGGAARTALSVRDLLAWAHFVTTAAPAVGHLPAYAHGAYLVLLDGIGLGLGMPHEAVRALRARCHAFLLQQLPPELADAAAAAAGHMAALQAQAPPGRWGLGAFTIERGSVQPAGGTLRFDFGAPTTARNASRVLRALQLRKAVLLEGSPGVGKTSLVAALAAASGRKLYRINLSEQTDIMDLLGADLPVEGGAAGAFAWCDGPLLEAVRQGAWVLLDELNLASQSVLEGLNAVLDHREEVFIPELGRTFHAAPGFRLFGAQNPVHEGGGRRGLPRSFLNRFTRVAIELLEADDLLYIAGALHPMVPEGLRCRMVAFLADLHHAANVARSFGAAGGPWEFNLRDLLRWCQLAEGAVPAGVAAMPDGAAQAIEDAAEHYVHLLIVQRLRTPSDRAAAAAAFDRAFGRPLGEHGRPSVAVGPEMAQIGRARLARASPVEAPPGEPAGAATKADGLMLLPGRLRELESLAECLVRGWPALLVGGAGSGKSSLAHVAAALAGRHLNEVALSAGSDTSDLLGGFEQLEPARAAQELLESVRCKLHASAAALLTAGGEIETQQNGGSNASIVPGLPPQHHAAVSAVAAALLELQQLESDRAVDSSSAGGPAQLLDHLAGSLKHLSATAASWQGAALQQLRATLEVLEAEVAAAWDAGDKGNTASAGRFEWVDGALTRAVEHGGWVLLRGANLAAPAVLDRLNALLEPGGTLVLNEAGSPGGGGPRVVQPHPDFRLILALDPRHGEVSRAMRNRGVEIFLLPEPLPAPTQPGAAAISAALPLPPLQSSPTDDLQLALAAAGVPGWAAPAAMAATHQAVATAAQAAHRQGPSPRQLRRWAELAGGLAARGWPVESALAVAFQQVYVRGQAAAADRAKMQAVFVQHCSCAAITATPLPAEGRLALVRPCAWPHPQRLSAALEDSCGAALALEASLLEGFAAELAAQQALQSPEGTQAALSSTIPAALLPWQLLQQRLKAGGGTSAAMPPAEPAAAAQRDSLLRLLWAAAACLAERCPPSAAAPASTWLRNLSAQLAAAPAALGWVAVPGAALQQVVAVLEGLAVHPAAAALTAARAQLQQLLALKAAAAAALPTDLTRADAIMPALAAVGALVNGATETTGAVAMWQTATAQAARLAAARGALAAHEQLRGAEVAAADAMAAGTASLLQLSYWRHIHPKVRARQAAAHEAVDWLYPLAAALDAAAIALLADDSITWSPALLHQQVGQVAEWQNALWRLSHCSRDAAADAGPASAVDLEGLALVALRLQRALSGLAGQLPEAAFDPQGRVRHALGSLLGSLGLAAGPPPPPLAWHAAGHPQLPASMELCELQARLHAAAASLGLVISGDTHRMTEGEQHAVSAARHEAAAVMLAADGSLKAALAEGLALFALAAARPAGTAAAALPGVVLNAASAQQPAQELLHELDARQEQAEANAAAADGAPLPSDTLALAAQPLPQLGRLPELMPLRLLAHEPARAMQQPLLQLAAIEHSSRQLDVLAQLQQLPPLLAVGRADAGGAALAPQQLQALQGGVSAALAVGAHGSPASALQLGPLQRLTWALDAARHDATQGCGALEEQLAETLHELWFRWHAAGSPPGGPAGGGAASSFRPGTAARSGVLARLAADGGAGAGVDVSSWPARVLQLRLAARHVGRLGTQAGQVQMRTEARQEWTAIALLLAQLLAAHTGAIPDAVTRAETADALAALVQAAQHHTQPASAATSAVNTGALQRLPQLLAAVQHATFQRVLAPLLLPCLAAVTQQLLQPYAHQDPGELAARGRAWALLGGARLALVAPPPGVDPAAKHGLQRAHLLRRLAEELGPELQVREALLALPGGLSESVKVADLRRRMTQLQQQADALEGKAVPRPSPPQYAALAAEAAAFTALGAGAPDRIAALVSGLQEGHGAAAATAEAWCANAAAWADRLTGSFPGYRDLTQPVALAVHEARRGFAMMAAAADIASPIGRSGMLGQGLADGGGVAEKLEGMLRTLMAFPAAAEASGGAAVVELASGQAQGLVATLAAASAGGKGAEVAAYRARLQLLRSALQIAVRAAKLAGPGSAAALAAQRLLAAFVAAWREVKAAQEAKAAEEAELFKTKTHAADIPTEEEESEASYQAAFPDHFAAFADVAVLEDEVVPADLEEAGSRPQLAPGVASEAEAGSTAAASLLGGATLRELVSLHDRLAGTAAAEADVNEQGAAFEAAYDLGAQLLAAVGGAVPARLDADLATGHLMRLCRTHAGLARPPAAETGAAVDLQGPVVEEAALLAVPVRAVAARLAQLLAEWPEHPILAQLAAICDRLLALPVRAPLKAALTGLELLLARAQLWEETAAAHVSLQGVLRPVAGLAGRWRKLELASWKGLLDRTVAGFAEGANQSWFHLYEVVQPPILVEAGGSTAADAEEALSAAGTTLEQFMQTATLGEYAARLALLASFRRHAAVQACVGPATQQAWWTGLGALLANVGAYYGQFAPAVQAALKDGLAPLEKQLQDFVRLASWEDRGYYAMRASTEKAQRHLHRLTRNANEVLKSPAAATVVATARGAGLDDLKAADAPGGAPAKGKPTRKRAAARAAKAPASGKLAQAIAAAAVEDGGSGGSTGVAAPPEAAADLAIQAAEEVQCEARLAWVAFSAAAAGRAQAPPAAEPAAEAAEGGQYLHRLPALTQRLGSVLQGALYAEPAADTPLIEGGLEVDGAAAAAAERALTLRSLTDKGARARKKAALTGLLQGLAALGVSRRRTAVPPAERSAQSWFRQALPELEHMPLLDTGSDGAAAPPAVVGAAADAWQSASDYYLRSIGRIQRLWEAAKAPHHDLSAAEVESAVRLSEHLLHLQRLQRRSLAAAAARHADVAALAAGLAELAAAPNALPPQGVTRERAAQQRAQLDTLWPLASDTHTLLVAAADTEPNAAAKAKLQTTAAHVATLIRTLEAARVRWANHFDGGSISAHLVPAAAAAALDANAEELRAMHAALAAADLDSGFADSVPAWSPLRDAVAAAVASSSPAVHPDVTALQQQQLVPAADGTATGGDLLEGVDAAVEQVLLWGQTVAAAQSAWAAPPAEGDGAPADRTIGQRWAQFEACAGLARLASLQESIAGLLSQLSAQADEPGGDSAAVMRAAQALGGLAPLLRLAAGGLQALALQALPLHRATAKLGYVATALFSGLVEQGFCMPDATREGEGGEGEGKFTEAEGTGLGDADTTGAKDVSDQIEDQDQLLGARQKDAPPQEPQPQQEATGPEEEQPQGVEMEDDFEGELQDVLEGERQEEEGEEGDEERLDQQMGDGGDGEQVVDERMWGEDEDKPRDADAKYEKDAPVQVEDKTDLDYQAGQDDAEDGGDGDDKQQQKPADGSKPQEQPQPEGAEGGDEQEEELPEQGDGINEDTADKYEDRQHAQPEGPPEDFELPEDMQLDGEGEGGGEDEDGQQEGEEAADAPEQGGAMPEAETQERQPQPAGEDEGGGEDVAAETDDAATEPEEGAEMEAGPEQGGVRPEDFDEEGAGAEEHDEADRAGGGEDAEADTAADQQQLPEAGPQGQASAAVQAAAAADGAGAGAEDEARRDEAAGAGAQQQSAPQGAEAADAQQSAAGAAGGGGGAQRGVPQRGAATDGGATEQQPHGKPLEANPLRGLGSALERWRARLAVRSDALETPQDEGAAGGEQQEGGQQEGEEGDAEFQYMHEDEQPAAGDTQALGAATEEQAAQLAAGLDRPEHGDEEMADMVAVEEAEPAPEAGGQLPQRQAAAVRSGAAGDSLRAAAEVADMDSEDAGQNDGEAVAKGEQEADEGVEAEGGEAGEPGASFISSRLAALEVAEAGEAAPEAPDPEQAARLRADLQAGLLAHAEAAGAAGDADDLAAGAAAWARCEALTAGLAGELAEQLRLILEPTIASRLAGDFRSGKRINMKKVIAFIASHFRRDKIWMRRTHPDKRKYQVVIAVDDSRSMAENGCGAVALEAVTLIARALARLEVGELGVLRFGGTSGVATLHELGRPFSDAEGPGLLAGLRFDADNTLADTPMVGLLSALGGLLDSARERASSGTGFGSEALQQLVLIVADGRFHEKAALQRAVREASERRGVLIAFIILDNPAASLLDMRTVSFVDGKPAFAQYLDTFPFPFYVVLRDIAALPATLADLLRQWFHLHAGQ